MPAIAPIGIGGTQRIGTTTAPRPQTTVEASVSLPGIEKPITATVPKGFDPLQYAQGAAKGGYDLAPAGIAPSNIPKGYTPIGNLWQTDPVGWNALLKAGIGDTIVYNPSEGFAIPQATKLQVWESLGRPTESNMGFLKSLAAVAAPIVGGILGGPGGAAIGGAIGGGIAGGPKGALLGAGLGYLGGSLYEGLAGPALGPGQTLATDEFIWGGPGAYGAAAATPSVAGAGSAAGGGGFSLTDLLRKLGEGAKPVLGTANTLLGLSSLASGGYGLYQANQMKNLTAPGQAAASQLTNLTNNPSLITSTPGYQFGAQQGQQALERYLAAQGQTGGGLAAAAIPRFQAEYAGRALQAEQERLARLALGTTAPQASYTDISSRALASLGYGLGRLAA